MKRVTYAKRGTPNGIPLSVWQHRAIVRMLPQEILSPRKDTSSPMASSGTAR